jgi:hypothetical protein
VAVRPPYDFYHWRRVVSLLLIFYSDLSQLNHHVHALALNKSNNVLSVAVIVFYFFSFTMYALSDTCMPSPTTLLSTYVSRVLKLTRLLLRPLTTRAFYHNTSPHHHPSTAHVF